MYLDKYRKYMIDGVYLQGDLAMFGRPLLSRYDTFEYVLDHLLAQPHPVTLVELGTSRSFVTGGVEGCMDTDEKYWKPHQPETWDHGAGVFTYLIPNVLHMKGQPFTLHTVDICEKAMSISKVITRSMTNYVQYHQTSSAEFLRDLTNPVDLIYMDTAETDEDGARIHFEDAKTIVERNLLKEGGLILIDDVRSPRFTHMAGKDWTLGKGKYSIPYFLQNGFQIIMDEYQMILTKSRATAGAAD